MSLTTWGLATLLSGDETARVVTVSRPARRWKSRILLPLAILAASGAIFAYSARSALLPLTDVWVAPVVAVPRTLAGSGLKNNSTIQGGTTHERGAMLVQAPGWIEPAPYAMSVPALAEGVVKEVLVLEGDRVEEGQVVVRLVDEDARLNVRAAEAELAALNAEAAKAQAEEHAARSRAEEVEDQLDRSRQLGATGGSSDAVRAQLAIRLKAAQHAVEAAQAALEGARASVRKQEVAHEQAQLVLKRMQVLAPHDGVVMARLVEPGTRISMSGRAAGEAMSGAIMRLYDPARLQVRVDVPLADFAKLRIGSDAEVVTEALPDVIFRGVLKRVVHEANIQRNTIPVKVSIENPSEVLKPEMLARVRFYESQEETSSPSESGNTPTQIARTDLRLLIPEGALVYSKSGQASVWLVKHDARAGGMIAVTKDIQTAVTSVPGYVEAVVGLQAGDRVIIDAPANLESGHRVRVLGEKQTQMSPSETRS